MSGEKILIVNGDRGAARSLEALLKKRDYQIIGKITGAEDALRLAAENRPDLVLINTRLEGKLDGLQAAEFLRSRLDLPVVFITKQSDEKFVQRMLEIGASGYLLHAFHPAELYALVEIALQQQRSARKIKESESRFRLMYERTGAAMLVVDPQTTRILDANPAACTFYGYSLEEMKRKRMTDLTDQSTIPAGEVMDHLQQARRGAPMRMPFRHRLANGESRRVELHSSPIEINGEVLLHTIVRDASDRTRTENTLRRRDQILSAVGYAAEQFFISQNWQNRIQDVLEQLGKATNSSRVYIFETQAMSDERVIVTHRFEWVARGVTARLHNPDFQQIDLVKAGLKRWAQELRSGEFIHGGQDDFPDAERLILQGMKVQSILMMPILVQGQWWGFIGFDQTKMPMLWADADIHALRAAAGILAGAIQRQQTQENLVLAEAKYREIFENAVEGVFQSTPQGQFITVNPALARMLGYETAEEMIAAVRNISTDLYVDPDRHADIVHLMEANNFVKNYTLKLRCKDGQVIWVTEQARAVRDEAGQLKYIEGFIQDITRQESAREAALRTLERYDDLVNSIDGIVWEADAEKERIKFVSQQAVRILGYQREDWMAPGFWKKHIHPEDRNAMLAKSQAALRELRPYTLEYRMLTAQGKVIWVRDIVTVIVRDGQPHLSGLIVDITEMHRHQRRLEVLVEISAALRSVESSAEMAPMALQTLLDKMPVEGALFAQMDAESGALCVTHGVGVFAARKGSQLGPELEIFHQVLADGLPFRHPAVHVEPALVNWVRPDDPHALVIAPLVAGERPLGALLAARREAFSTEDADMLLSYGGLVANAIQRALSNERMERSLNQLNTLHEIDRAINATMDLKVSFSSVLVYAMAQLGADALDVYQVNQLTRSIELVAHQGFRTPITGHHHLRLGQSMAGQAVMERRTVYKPDLRLEKEQLDRPTLLAAESMVTYYGIPLISNETVRGVLEVFYRTPFELSPELQEFLDILAGQMALAIHNSANFNRLERTNWDLKVAIDETLEGWAKALDLRDQETQGHSRRVTDMTLRLAQELRVAEDELESIRHGALLHDIGKMGIPDAILLKRGPLTAEERTIMKEHTRHAQEMLSSIPFLRPALDIPYYHHEKWDGSGYPHGLKGEEIPLAARIFAVVDVWDALMSDRPYRAAWPEERVLTQIRQDSGTHFDPQVVKIFLELRERESGILPGK